VRSESCKKRERIPAMGPRLCENAAPHSETALDHPRGDFCFDRAFDPLGALCVSCWKHDPLADAG
jgi:hypothetical protein